VGKEETFPLFLFISTSHFTKDGPDKHGFLIERYIYFPFNHKCHFTALNHYIRDAILKHSLGNNPIIYIKIICLSCSVLPVFPVIT
jgi:hypothetical protein